jgi:hypothetical protein
MSDTVIKTFFHMNLNIKLYHWQTQKYARHIASDALLTLLLVNIDRFVETYSGRYERPDFKQVDFEVKVSEFNDKTIVSLLNYYVKFLKTELPKHLQDTDLLNIRDDMLADINKTLYLFTLE